MRHFLVLLLTLGLVGFAPAPVPKPNKVLDLPALAGSWQLSRYLRGDKDSLLGRNMRISIQNNTCTFFVTDPGQAERKGSTYVMKVDPTAKPPMFSWFSQDGKTRQFVGTYKADRNKLIIVFVVANLDDSRPTDFDKLGPLDYLMELTRLPGS